MPVTHFDLMLQRPLAEGRAFGEVGPYEELKGRLRYSIDPTHAANARITDVERAPRNRDGRVEFAADVSILLPVDRARGNGRVILDVVNRGNTVTMPNFNHATRPVLGPDADPNPSVDVGDGFLMRHGYTVISCGWQCDVPELPGLFRLHASRGSRHRRAQPLARARLRRSSRPPSPCPTSCSPTAATWPYPAADLEEPDATLLTVRDQLDGAPAADRPREAGGSARGRRRPRRRRPALRVDCDGGFEKGRLYQIAYTAVGRAGAGRVAWRRCATPCPGSSTAARPAPAGGGIRWALRLRALADRPPPAHADLRDLNLDEQGREAFDGIIANVAGGMRGEFNQRFGQNSKDRPHMMAHVFPFDRHADDRPGDGHDRRAACARSTRAAAGSSVFYTNTSAEYHRGDASLIHTDPDGMRDVAAGPHVRIYHFAGTEHGLGVWPPTDTTPIAADPSGLDRALPEPARHRQLRARCSAPASSTSTAWVTEGDRAAAESPPARQRRHRGPARVAGQGLRARPGAALPAPPRAAAPPRLRRRRRAARDGPGAAA